MPRAPPVNDPHAAAADSRVGPRVRPSRPPHFAAAACRRQRPPRSRWSAGGQFADDIVGQRSAGSSSGASIALTTIASSLARSRESRQRALTRPVRAPPPGAATRPEKPKSPPRAVAATSEQRSSSPASPPARSTAGRGNTGRSRRAAVLGPGQPASSSKSPGSAIAVRHEEQVRQRFLLPEGVKAASVASRSSQMARSWTRTPCAADACAGHRPPRCGRRPGPPRSTRAPPATSAFQRRVDHPHHESLRDAVPPRIALRRPRYPARLGAGRFGPARRGPASGANEPRHAANSAASPARGESKPRAADIEDMLSISVSPSARPSSAEARSRASRNAAGPSDSAAVAGQFAPAHRPRNPAALPAPAGPGPVGEPPDDEPSQRTEQIAGRRVAQLRGPRAPRLPLAKDRQGRFEIGCLLQHGRGQARRHRFLNAACGTGDRQAGRTDAAESRRPRRGTSTGHRARRQPDAAPGSWAEEHWPRAAADRDPPVPAVDQRFARIRRGGTAGTRPSGRTASGGAARLPERGVDRIGQPLQFLAFRRRKQRQRIAGGVAIGSKFPSDCPSRSA